MIFCLSLNPSLDKTASLPRFTPDAPNRITVERLDVGGKGVNVARMLRRLGGPCTLIGFDYEGAPIQSALSGEVPCRLTSVPGRLRTNMKLRETETGHTIEISEQGAAVNEALLEQTTQAILSQCRPGDWVTLSGSLPPGVGKDTYARLCRRLKERGCRVAADCDGPALQAVLAEGPHLMKPNAQEFAALTGTRWDRRADVLRACGSLHQGGVETICLSLGPEGALLSTPNGAFLAAAAPVTPRGVQGAGDSMLAGLLLALSRGANAPEALRLASAAAGASVMQPGTLLGEPEDVQRLLPLIQITPCCS